MQENEEKQEKKAEIKETVHWILMKAVRTTELN